jgi:hypothetical protein
MGLALKSIEYLVTLHLYCTIRVKVLKITAATLPSESAARLDAVL